MDENNLYEKMNYTTPVMYIDSAHIREYDIRSANITMLRGRDIISQEQYEYLSRLPKMDREKYVGIMIGEDRDIYEEIKKGITYAKQCLVELNRIKDSEIVRIANDAIYINRDLPLRFRDISLANNIVAEFKIKAAYHSFIRLGDLSIFYNIFDNYADIRVIGIKDDLLTLHSEYFLSFLLNYFKILRQSTPEDCIKYFKEFYNDYVNRKLDIGYYREFNSNSCFRLIGKDNWLISYALEDYNKSSVDINYNAYILRELYARTLTLYIQNLNI